MFQLISKESCAEDGWIKTISAMHIADVGCVIQSSTERQNGISESLVFVPGVKVDYRDGVKRIVAEL